jgi:hypothetical protein
MKFFELKNESICKMERVKCDCGSDILKSSLKKHLTTKKHLDYINEHKEEVKKIVKKIKVKKVPLSLKIKIPSLHNRNINIFPSIADRVEYLTKNLKFGKGIREDKSVKELSTHLLNITKNINIFTEEKKELENVIIQLKNSNITLRNEYDNLSFYQFLKSSEIANQISTNDEIINKLSKQIANKDEEIKSMREFKNYLDSSLGKVNRIIKKENKEKLVELKETKESKENKEESKESKEEKLKRIEEEILERAKAFIGENTLIDDDEKNITFKRKDTSDNLVHFRKYTLDKSNPHIEKILDAILPDAINEMEKIFKSNNGYPIKIQIEVQHLLNDRDGNEQSELDIQKFKPASMFNKFKTIASLNQIDVQEIRNEVLKKIYYKVYHAITKSGYSIRGYSSIKFKIIKTTANPNAGKYIPVPLFIKQKKCVIDLKNDDDKCLEYSIKFLLNKNKFINDRTSKRILHRLQNDKNIPELKNIPSPFNLDLTHNHRTLTFKKLSQIEEENNISIRLYQNIEKEDTISVIYASNHRSNQIHLLVLSNEDNTLNHILPITRITRLFSESGRNGKHHNSEGIEQECSICRKKFMNTTQLMDHLNFCINDIQSGQTIIIPEGDNYKKFKSFDKFLSPFIVKYGDIETSCVKDIDGNLIHKANSICSVSISEFDESEEKIEMLVSSSDEEESCKIFIRQLLDEQENIISKISEDSKLSLSEEQEKIYEESTKCYFCEKPFITSEKDEMYKYFQKVKHHNHFIKENNFIGASHKSCNLKAKKPLFIPVVFHNGGKFDSKFIIRAIISVLQEEKYRVKRDEVSESKDFLIKNQFTFTSRNRTAENVISFSIGIYRFIDSIKFLPASLEKLIESSKKSNIKFKYIQKFMKQIYPEIKEEQLNLLFQKGEYPYEYVDSVNKFSETSLPPIEAFFSSLRNRSITIEQYQHAQNVWNSFNCKTFLDYHKLYLYIDVLGLADVFETFRKTFINDFKLDPINFISLPAYGDEAMLLMMKKKKKYKKEGIKLFTLRELYEDVNAFTNGGICHISKRYHKANNKYCSNFDKSKPISYIVGFDVNNLYPSVMRNKLPTDCGEYLKDEELLYFINNWKTIDSNGENGYIICSDNSIPESLHDKFNDLPLEASKSLGQVSNYNEKIYKVLGEKYTPICKLICDLTNKTNHWESLENLQFMEKQGYKIEKINKVIRFNQSCYMRDFIEFNTKRRKEAMKQGNDFLVLLYKLINNSVYGKQLLNEANFGKTVLCFNDNKKLLKHVNSPFFTNIVRFDNECYLLQMQKAKVEIRSPKIVGAMILNKSKLIVQSFFYNVLKSSKDLYNVELLFTDTDSLYCVLYPKSDDIKDFINNNRMILDLSSIKNKDYLDLKDTTNQGKLGYMKIENDGQIISEIIGLRPKLYSYKTLKNNKVESKIKTKGVTNTDDIDFDNFYSCFIESSKVIDNQKADKDLLKQRTMNGRISSKQFSLKTIQVNKVSLTSCDDKRYILTRDEYTPEQLKYSNELNGIYSLSFGNFRIKRKNL